MGELLHSKPTASMDPSVGDKNKVDYDEVEGTFLDQVNILASKLSLQPQNRRSTSKVEAIGHSSRDLEPLLKKHHFDSMWELPAVYKGGLVSGGDDEMRKDFCDLVLSVM